MSVLLRIEFFVFASCLHSCHLIACDHRLRDRRHHSPYPSSHHRHLRCQHRVQCLMDTIRICWIADAHSHLGFCDQTHVNDSESVAGVVESICDSSRCDVESNCRMKAL